MFFCNLMTALLRKEAEEITENLVVGNGTRVERIVSHGQASPDGFWYDQSEDEFVVVLSGRAKLTVEGRQQDLVLGPGDAVYLPAHCRHRVAWTDPKAPTVWLAAFWDPKLAVAPAGPLAADTRQSAKSRPA
jgi:cupin 2 domain-containing protein